MLTRQVPLLFGGFSPLRLPGLALWLKADGTLWQDSARTTPAAADGDPVGAWDDASGNGRHVVQATAGSRPTLKLAIQNGRPVLRFDGVDDWLGFAAGFGGTAPFSTLVVYKKRVAGGDLIPVGSAGEGNPSPIVEYSDGNFYCTSANTYGVVTAGEHAAAFVMTSVVVPSEGVHNIWFNGVAQAVAETAGGGTSTFARVGARLNLYTDGDIGEIILGLSAWSDADRIKVEAYARARWGTP